MVVYSKNVLCLSNLQIKIGLERVVENKKLFEHSQTLRSLGEVVR
jgi:hypothetical protein